MHTVAASYNFDMPTDGNCDSTFTLYRRGMELLADEDFEDATVPLEQAARQAPEKSSVREALGRALAKTGQTERARHHLALASNLRPERRDYRFYRELLSA